MRCLAVLMLFFVTIISKAGIQADTISYWHISYGKTIILEGNDNTQAGRYEIVVKNGSVKDLTISISQDARSQNGLLIIREKNEVLRTIEQDPVIGAYFVVPIRELISTHQPNVQYELEFYYSITGTGDGRKLATIIFNFK